MILCFELEFCFSFVNVLWFRRQKIGMASSALLTLNRTLQFITLKKNQFYYCKTLTNMLVRKYDEKGWQKLINRCAVTSLMPTFFVRKNETNLSGIQLLRHGMHNMIFISFVHHLVQ